MSNYPTGAEYDPRAPYNEDEDGIIKVEITMTISKIVTIPRCRLDNIESTIILPSEAYKHISMVDNRNLYEDLKGWEVNELNIEEV